MLTCTTIDHRHRNTRPAALLGPMLYLLLEPRLYSFADILIENYRGAYWEMHEVSNGGFFMTPSLGQSVTLSCPNGYRGTMTTEAAGLTLALYSFSHLSFHTQGQLQASCANQYHWLRGYAMEHAEAEAIFQAID